MGFPSLSRGGVGGEWPKAMGMGFVESIYKAIPISKFPMKALWLLAVSSADLHTKKLRSQVPRQSASAGQHDGVVIPFHDSAQ